MSFIRDPVALTWSGIEITAQRKTSFSFQHPAAQPINRVCDVGTTTLTFSPPIPIALKQNWKGELQLAPADDFSIGGGQVNPQVLAQPPGPVIIPVVIVGGASNAKL